jgi:hypothetical protein
MSEKKDLKRAAQQVWDRVKVLRGERGKLYSADDLETSAAALAECASELKAVATRKSALSAMPAASGATVTAIKKSKKPTAPGEA